MADKWVFNDIEDLCRNVVWLSRVMRGQSVTVLGTFEELYPIVNYILKNTDYELFDVDFRSGEIDGYNLEYGMTLDDEGYMWIEKAIRVKEDGTKSPVYFDNLVFAYTDVDKELIKENKALLFDVDDGEDEPKYEHLSGLKFNKPEIFTFTVKDIDKALGKLFDI